MKRVAFVVLLLSTIFASWAQSTATIRGKVMLSDEKLPVVGAIVKLNAADTAKLLQRGRVVVTGADGRFTIYSKEKKSDITIGYLGYRDQKIDIPVGQSSVDMGTVTLVPSTMMIENVQVVARASMSKISGDTVQFNAAAFKTNPDATTEDLLKKMPGVTTDESGNLESQGQKITKVYVNGKEYFDDDPSLALKSLPQDAVESIQLYDDKSDDAKFSGFDDGQRIRAVNIVTKKGVMNSTFGKAYVGYGNDNRYSAGVGVNTFSDKHRFTVVAQTNNVNNQGFTLSDISSSGGGRGGRGRFSSGGSDLSGFSTPSYGGITQSAMAGINYNGQFSEKFKMSGSYFFNWRAADAWSIRNQEYLTTERNYYAADSSLGYESSHRLRLRTEWSPNDNNRIVFNPSFNYTLNHGASLGRSITTLDGVDNNRAHNNYDTHLERFNGSADLWWQHRFDKAGRTMSLGAVASGSSDNGQRTQLSAYEAMAIDGTMNPELLRQIGQITSNGYSLTGSATYTEPISKSSRLSANYSITYDQTISDKQGFNWDDYVQQYVTQDTSTTNYINRNYTTQLAGVGYGFVKGNAINLSANVSYQHASLNNAQTTLREIGAIRTASSFEAVLPSVRFSYTPQKGQNLNVDYRTNSIFPSVNQLQTALNTDNPLQVSRGNANLKQSYSHQLSLRYNYSNTEKNLNFNLYGSASQTSNYISTHRRFLEADTVVGGTTIVRGAQYSEPVNLKGYFNSSIYSTFGFGIRPIKSNMNVTLFYRYSHTPSMQDNVTYLSSNNRIGGNLSLTSNISENVDFTISYRPGLNLTQGGTGRFDRYFSHDLTAFVNVIFLKHFFVNADASWRNSFGTQEAYNQHFALVNAAVGAKFLKNNSGEVRLAVYDALGQNLSLRQNATDTYIQTTRSQVLQQYFMLSFTYKFDTRKNGSSGASSSSESSTPRGMGRGGSMRHY